MIARATPVAVLAPALVLAALVGCDHRARTEVAAAGTEAPDLAGLKAVLDRDLATIAGAGDRRAAATAVVADWMVPATAWPTLVTERFRPLHAAYAAAFAITGPAVTDELLALRGPTGQPADGALAPSRSPSPWVGPIEVRWQYADDPRLGPDQARLRVALPVGRPGAIVTVAGRPLTPVFVHDGQRWRTLAGLDQAIVARLAARAPACVAPYQAAARPPCLAMSAPVIDAVLADDPRELERACARLLLNGCGP